jgi:pyruvate dehydrogenase E1 component
MMGATAGRTTLTGEGLQHDDGHSHILASTVPNVLAYDPAFAYELAIIVREGIRRMYGEAGEDVFYYLTLYNENWAMPPKPDGVEEGVLRGLYRFRTAERGSRHVQLLGSGSILHQALRAQELLAERYDVAADVWSVPSFQQLRNDALSAEQIACRGGADPYVVQQLGQAPGPIVAATDYLVASRHGRALVDRPFTVLGTDGFGRSDIARRCMHFEVSPRSPTPSTASA